MASIETPRANLCFSLPTITISVNVIRYHPLSFSICHLVQKTTMSLPTSVRSAKLASVASSSNVDCSRTKKRLNPVSSSSSSCSNLLPNIILLTSSLYVVNARVSSSLSSSLSSSTTCGRNGAFIHTNMTPKSVHNNCLLRPLPSIAIAAPTTISSSAATIATTRTRTTTTSRLHATISEDEFNNSNNAETTSSALWLKPILSTLQLVIFSFIISISGMVFCCNMHVCG